MPSHDGMVRAVEAYVAAFDRSDPDAVRDLFAADGTVEDPVGTPPQVGHDAIRAFYERSMKTGAKLTLEGPVRSAGNTAAFAFAVHLTFPSEPMRIDVIDVFQFDEAGKISSMKAYFSEANMHHGVQADA